LLSIAKCKRPQAELRRYEKATLAHVIPAALRLHLVINEINCFADWL
jgi:hypothetical protein